jgi:hypothetical protein
MGNYWLVTSSDQLQWRVPTSKYPDELAAYMVVTEILKKEQERATRTQTEEGQDRRDAVAATGPAPVGWTHVGGQDEPV